MFELPREAYRPRREKWDLGLQFTAGPKPGDMVKLFDRWWLVESVWMEKRNMPTYELVLA